MSKPSRDNQKQDEDECFYESLDHILSSTNSSCSPSASSEEEDNTVNFDLGSPNYAPGCPLPIHKFPMGVLQNYDVWISEPSSVEERRMRLLRQMGLSRDLALSPQKSPALPIASDTGDGKFGRSVSSDRIRGDKSINMEDEYIRRHHKHEVIRENQCISSHSLSSSSPTI